MFSLSSDRRSSHGFTLVELLVTIAILAILAMIAAPSMSQFLIKQQLNKSARELSATLTLARSQAALLNTTMTVKLNSTDADNSTTFNWFPSGGVQYKSTTTTSVIFLPNGSVGGFSDAQTAISLNLCDADGKKARTISISVMGTLKQTQGAC